MAPVQSLVFAHPSERYLKVMQVGAQGSGLTQDYQAWMHELKPYRCTCCMQPLVCHLQRYLICIEDSQPLAL